MPDGMYPESIYAEVEQIQQQFRANKEYRKVNILDMALSFIENRPKFLKLRRIINPDTNKTLEWIDKRPCVAVLVTDNRMENVLLVKQYRAGCTGPIHEVVAGVVEPDQEPIDAVYAELRQEVGILEKDIYTMRGIGPFYSSVGWTNEIAHLYIVVLKKDFTQMEQQLDEGESLTYTWEDVNSLSDVFKDQPVPIKTGMLIQNFYRLKEDNQIWETR